MTDKKSIWNRASDFLALTRKIFINGVTAILLVVITFSILGGFASSFSGEEKIDTKDKVLWFKPIGVVVDSGVNSSDISLDQIISGGGQVEQHELQDLLDVLNNAATDENLSAVYLNVSELGMYWSSAFKLADAVKNVKDSGKRVIAYASPVSGGYTNSSYLISSQANEVFINEYGAVQAFGFSRKREYMVDFYENIKLNFNVFTAGDFKSGPEPYTRNSMSDADKLAWNEFANPMWKKMTTIMETGRGLSEGTIQNYGDNAIQMMAENAEYAEIAKNLGLVDHIVTVEELKSWMFEEYPNDEGDKFSFPDSISIYDYLSTLDKKEVKSSNNIAIINVEGAIMTGEVSYGVAGSDTIVENIQDATEDESVKALVLRVNSPGGGVYASELITNALNEFKDTGRPIVSSMGDIAASGGVWVTTSSDEIWAENDTLTGSIGVYGIVPTLDGLYDWAGITVDGTSSTKAAEWDPRLEMPTDVKTMIQASIDNTYFKFVSKVASNRGMSYEDVLPIAGGRIWAGNKALELGLVDAIGGLDEALSSAAEMADITDYQVKTYKQEMDPFELFLSELLENVDFKISSDPRIEFLNSVLPKHIKLINPNEKSVLAYCFECDLE